MQAGFQNSGELDSVQINIYADNGIVSSESSSAFAASILQNVYASKAWELVAKDVHTDTAANTYCRTPGISRKNNIMIKYPFDIKVAISK